MVRRVRRPRKWDALLGTLTDSENGGPFDNYRDALVFAAALAASKGERLQFTVTSEPIDYNIFGRANDLDALFYVLALFREKSLEWFTDARADDRVTVFEEYANAGLGIINDALQQQGGPPIVAITHLIFEGEPHEPMSGEISLEDITKRLREG